MLRMCSHRFQLLLLSAGFLLASASTWAADKLTASELIALADAHSPDLRAAIDSTFDAKDLKDGNAWAGHGPDFFFAVESASAPALVVDDAAAAPMQSLAGSQLWYALLALMRSRAFISFTTSSTAQTSAAVSISRPSDRLPILNPVSRPANSQRRSSTPAKSTTA